MNIHECASIVRSLTPEWMHEDLYIVGGACRDALMQIPIGHDIDVVVDRASEEDRLDLLMVGFKQVDNKTFPVFMKTLDDIEVQIAFGREEQHDGARHNDVKLNAYGVSIEQDALRRDLTINSIMYNIKHETFVDHLGGIKHLHEKKLVPCSTAFADDSERAFRAFRFASQLDFEFSPELREVCKKCAEKFDFLPSERVFDETMKAMKGIKPSRFFREMVATNIGHQFFSELFESMTIPSGPESEHHPRGETVFDHSMKVLDTISELTLDPKTRLAAVYHDVGKLRTPREEWPLHHDHDHLGEEMISEIALRLHMDSETKKVCRLVARHHMKAGIHKNLKASTWLKTAQECGVHIKALIDVCKADSGEDISKPLTMAFNAMAATATEMGLVDKFEGKTGEAIKNMVWGARVSRLKKLLKTV